MVEVLNRNKARDTTLDREMITKMSEVKPTSRIERLRKRLLYYKPAVEIDGIRIATKVMQQTEGEPTVTRVAKAFAAVIREVPIKIFDDELIVGCQASTPRAVNASAEIGGFLEAELDILGTREQDPFYISDESKKTLRKEVFPYWRAKGRYERTVDGRTYQLFPPEVAEVLFSDPDKYPTEGTGVVDIDVLRVLDPNHTALDYENVLKKGFLEIKREVEGKLAKIDYSDPMQAQKASFLNALIVALEAAAEIGQRFAAEARELAAREEDAERKAELLEISGICDRVPADPARTFHEALQSLWFAHILVGWELYKNVVAMSPGRLDQYLLPYYKADLLAGRITKEKAQELIDCLFLKFASTLWLISTNVARYHAGSPGAQHVNVGGLKADGSDATNELSYMLIEAMMHTRMPQPTFCVRIHSKTPDDFLLKACQLTSLGTGHPSFFNDDVVVPALLARGTSGGPPISLELARTYAMVGCVEPQIVGKEGGWSGGGFINLAAAMEFVLTNGMSRIYNRKIGVETGNPRQFRSFDEVREAYRRQLARLVQINAAALNICELSIGEMAPSAYQSALLEDCVEKGRTRESGGTRYNFGPCPLGVGIADVGDSLTAIRKLVFEDKRIKMDELCDALDKNFEGYDNLRKMLLKVPKYGNGNDYPDEQVTWVGHAFAEEVKKYKNTRGGYHLASIIPVSSHVPLGMVVGALPSGRLAGTPLADGCSPSQGSSLEGPTAVLKSVSKIDHAEFSNGTQLNMRIDPAIFRSADGFKRLADLLRTIVDYRVWHVQFNVVSSDTLRAAQKEPDMYRDLVVKVAGYNAFFVMLHKSIQDNIIARAEYRL